MEIIFFLKRLSLSSNNFPFPTYLLSWNFHQAPLPSVGWSYIAKSKIDASVSVFICQPVTFWLKSSFWLCRRLEPWFSVYRCIIFLSNWSNFSLDLVYCIKTVRVSWMLKINIARNARHYDKMCKLLCWNEHGRDLILCLLHEHFKTKSCFGMEYFSLSPHPWKKKKKELKQNKKIFLYC